MFDHIILHIGATKTGTSAIQTALSRNRDLLLENGIYYPPGGDDQAALKGSVTGGNIFKLNALRKLHLKGHCKDTRKQIRAYFQSISTGINAPVLLLSGEVMGGMHPAFLEELRAVLFEFTREVKIVYYIRHIAEHAKSQYSEYLKRRRMQETLGEFIPSYRSPYMRALSNYENAFGREAIQVRLFNAVRSDLLSDFSNAIGLKDLKLESVPTVNRSLSYTEQEIMRRLNKINPKRLRSSDMAKHLMLLPPLDHFQQTISSDQIEVLETNNREVLDFVNTHYASSWELKICDPEDVATTTDGENVEFDHKDEYYLELLKMLMEQNLKLKTLSTMPKGWGGLFKSAFKVLGKIFHARPKH